MLGHLLCARNGPCSGGQSQEREEKERGLEAGSHVSALPATPYSQNSEEAEDSKFKLAFQVLMKLSSFR